MSLADEGIVCLRMRRDCAAVLADGTILHVSPSFTPTRSVAKLRIAGGDHVYDGVDVHVGRELGQLDR
jgi:hypothetical protein